MHLKNRQTTLWPLYSFDVIPIELISNIYQRFVHIEETDGKKSNRGSHYTPYHLSAFLLDQVLPWDNDKCDISILDPSCGSGIFLVESYRRLIHRWMIKNKGIRPSITDLNQILKNSIFGMDVNEKAIRIAALSLYLTLCDYLEPRDILNNLKFVSLINNNLFISDFFEKNEQFSKKKFDLIIGNPPWESQIPPSALEYLKANSRPIGDNQICQAFLWRVIDLAKPMGEICLIVSSKSLLFNRSNPNTQFRKSFFSEVCVKTIVNFSILRHSLFSEAIGPAAAVIFSISSECPQPIAYCNPKPSFSPQDNWLFIIEPQDIAEISRNDSINDNTIWKIAMWGNPRDYELIKKISQLSTLNQITKKYNWSSGEGYIRGKKGRTEDRWLYNKPVVLIESLQRFFLDEAALPKNIETEFIRGRVNREIYRGPHLLIGQSPKNEGLIAAILHNEAVFSDAIVGIHSPEADLDKLAICCAIINSKLAFYYEILTSRKWLVERAELQKEEIMNLPIPENLLDSQIFGLNDLKIISKNLNSEVEIDKIIKEWYNLDESELILINDTIDFTLDYYKKKSKSIAVKQASIDDLEKYGTTFCKVLNNSFSSEKRFKIGNIFKGNGPLKVLSIILEDSSSKFSPNQYDERLEDVLKKLDAALLNEISPSIFIRRSIRRFSKNSIFIVKPNQIRFWTKSSALRDADETYKEIMVFDGESK
jgi:hypothetical protein